MTEEEKKAIKSIEEFAYTIHGTLTVGEAKTILNLIQKQQDKIAQLESDRQKLIEKLEEVKQKDEQWNALNGELAVWTFAQEILKIMKGGINK